MSDDKSKLVYSTDQPVPRKGGPAQKPLLIDSVPRRQKVTVRLEKKARGGKSVTVIEGLQLGQNERQDLLKQLKTRLGTGGTVKDSTLEIQGDHRDALMASLEKMGYRPKRSGG